MFETIKKIGIFIILAQAILYFVPGNAYMKYVKALVGVMIIAQLARPVFSLISGEEWREIDIQTRELSKMLHADSKTREIEEKVADIYTRMEEEIKEEAEKAAATAGDTADTEETENTEKTQNTEDTADTEESEDTADTAKIEEMEEKTQDITGGKQKIKVEKIEILRNP